jgi:hypothetical protein
LDKVKSIFSKTIRARDKILTYLRLKYVCLLNFKKNGTALYKSKFEIQSRITREVEMLEPFRLHILSSQKILKRNQ